VRMPLLVLALCAVAVTGQAQAPAPSVSFGPPFSTFAADTGKIACVSWGPRRPARDTGQYLSEAIPHAWIYGFVVGAAHVSPERLARVNADTVDAWMDTLLRETSRATIGYAAAVLVEELGRMR
jgi:hypothetical protein